MSLKIFNSKNLLKTLSFITFCLFLQVNGHSQWTQMGADIDGEAGDDFSGRSVSLSADGQTVAIGATANDGTAPYAGHVRVYNYDGTNWNQMGADIDGEAEEDLSGYSVSISDDGQTVAIGAPSNNGSGSNAGHVRVYNYDGTNWNQMGADIDGEAAQDNSGHSVSLSSDGQTVAIGAYLNKSSNDGHVRVYNYDGTSWAQMGADIDGEAIADASGFSVSLSTDGQIVAIGAYQNDGTASNAGHVRVYNYDGTSWMQMGADIDGEAASDWSGYSLSISTDGETVAIGACLNDGTALGAGHVRVYNYDGANWNQMGADINGEAYIDRSGWSVSLSDDGQIVAIGAYQNDGTASNAGHVRVYNYDGTNWNQLGVDIDGEAEEDRSGFSVSLSSDGGTVAIGAHYNDGTASNAGHVRVYNICLEPNEPTVTASPATHSCPGEDVTLSISGDLNDANSWEVYTGSCGGTSEGSTSSSSIVVNPTSTTTYYIRGEGGCTTPGTCGTVTVTVNPDVTAPVISGCPSDISVPASAGGCTATATWTDPTFTDECLGGSISGTHTSGTTFSEGTTTVTYTATDGAGNTATCSFDVTVTNDLAVVVDSIHNANCTDSLDGQIFVTVSGGTTAYSYDWDHDGGGDFDDAEDQNGLGEGTYNLIVEDANGCQASTSGSITEPTALVISLDSTWNNICFGDTLGDLFTTISGGTAPYVIDWDEDGAGDEDDNDDITNLAAGTYIMEVTDDNGCVNTLSADVTEPIEVLVPISTAICSNDSLLVGGGYQSTTGVYYDTLATTIGCDSIVETTLSVDPVFETTFDELSICEGDSVMIFGSYYSTDGVYYDSLTTILSCDSVQIQELIVNNVDENVTVIAFDTLIADASGTGINYQWMDCNDSSLIAGETNQTYNPTQDGDYAVIIDDNGCVDTSACYQVSGIGFGFGELVGAIELSIYPNPTSGLFTIKTSNTDLISIDVYNVLGRLIHTQQLTGSLAEIDLSSYDRGAYLISINTDKGTIRKEIVLQ